MTDEPRTEAGRALSKRPFDVFTPVEDEDDPADCCHVHVGRLLDAIRAIERQAAQAATERAEGLLKALDVAYRERAALVAALIRVGGYPAELVIAPDTEDWWIVYAETPAGQVSWHLSPDDLDLFSFLPLKFGSRPSPWDGHTTEEKYRRVAALAPVAPQDPA